MEELIDENGQITGRVETRKEVHKKGLWHKVIIVAIIDENGNILMQQRADNKETNPGKWDISTAGHIESGQTSRKAAIREIKEELGIDINEDELIYIDTYKKQSKLKENYYSNHFFDFYIIKMKEIPLDKIKMQKSEVKEVKLCSKKEVEGLIKEGITIKREEVYNELLNKYLR